MRWELLLQVYALFLAVVLVPVRSEDKKENELNDFQPNINLDEKLRKALLKALNELELEEKSKNESYDGLDDTTTTDESLDYSDKTVEKAQASAVSFLTGSTTLPSTDNEDTSTGRPVVIIQRSNGIQHRPIITVLHSSQNVANQERDNEQMLASASNGITTAQNSNNLQNEQINVTPKVEVTTTTTTAAPTTTEESQAKVEDVQFFSAPLVTAFTVHQDERGFPKRVVPIYRQQQQTVSQGVSAEDLYRKEILEKQRILEQQLLQLQKQQREQEYLFRQQQLLLQQQNQNRIEEQARIQNNQKPFVPLVNTAQNQPVLNNQAFSQPIVQTTVRSNIDNTKFNNGFSSNQISQPFNKLNSQSPQANSIVQQNKQAQKGTVVAFQPSISFSPTTQQLQLPNYSPLTFQQPPIKNAVDFRKNPFQNQAIQAPASFQQSPTVTVAPQVLSNFQPHLRNQQLPNNNFNIPQTLQQLQPPLQQAPVAQNFLAQNQQTQQLNNRNRFNRQEANTGNFLNNDYRFTNQFSQPLVQQQQVISHKPVFQQHQSFIEPQQSQQQQQNRFFRSNYQNYYNVNNNFRSQQQQPVVTQQLNNLLYQSGISNLRQNEDFNLISKVLSLNHLGGNDNYFSASRYAEQRVPAPYTYRTI